LTKTQPVRSEKRSSSFFPPSSIPQPFFLFAFFFHVLFFGPMRHSDAHQVELLLDREIASSLFSLCLLFPSPLPVSLSSSSGRRWRKMDRSPSEEFLLSPRQLFLFLSTFSSLLVETRAAFATIDADISWPPPSFVAGSFPWCFFPPITLPGGHILPEVTCLGGRGALPRLPFFSRPFLPFFPSSLGVFL